MSKKVLLMILDGWGITKEGEEAVSAIVQAHSPFMDKVWNEEPHSRLQVHGLAVGLPEGQMGNSEVGHINLGAGRVVYQELMKINMAIEDHSLHKNKLLLDALSTAKEERKKVHFMGLVSDGGIHADIKHLKALCTIAHEQEVQELYVHAFTDGRDTDPNSGIGFLEELEEHMHQTTGKLASITGRYYAMDRGKNYDRTAKAYQALVNGKAETYAAAPDWKAAMQRKYDNGETDEFIKPIVLTGQEKPVATIAAGDVVVCFNFRTDRARQLTEALTQQNFPDHNMQKLDLHYLTITRYDETYENVGVLFENENLKNTLGEVLAKAGKKQIRISETIKYPHVTYFFNGGREEKFDGEERILIDSPDVPTFDQKPEMSAERIRDAMLPRLKEQSADFICLNFVNADMVGHTGDMEAAIKACETVDSCAQAVTEAALAAGYAVIILADHGNSDKMKTPDGSPFTAHTLNPVPCILLGADQEVRLKDGGLSDIAPTVLSLMGIPVPEEMSGKVLIEKK